MDTSHPTGEMLIHAFTDSACTEYTSCNMCSVSVLTSARTSAFMAASMACKHMTTELANQPFEVVYCLLACINPQSRFGIALNQHCTVFRRRVQDMVPGLHAYATST